MPDQQLYDAIVVGSGAAGSWAAKELCEKGLTVLLLEAGRDIDPQSDFPLPAPPERRLLARTTSGLTRQPIQMRCVAFNERTRRFFVDDRQNPYSTPAGKPFNWFRGRQVGGRLHVWARVTLRLSDREFKSASCDGFGVDWPISYEDLAPWYDRVEAFLGVDCGLDGVPGVPDGRLIGPLALTPEERRFKDIVERAFPGRRVIGARVAPHRAGRVPLTIVAAQKTGRLVLRSNAVVRSVSVDPDTGKATGVSFVDRLTKEGKEVRGNIVVLCASTIETLRIMLNSVSSPHPAGLANSSGRLGHYLMDHVLTGLGGPLPKGASSRPSDEDLDPYDVGRATGIYIPRFRNAESRHPGFLRGYGIQGGIGREAPNWYFLAHGEMLPRFENCVTLDPERTDAWGVPVVRISCGLSPNETAMIADQVETMREMAVAAGLPARMPSSGKLLETLAFRVWRRRLLSETGAFLPGSAAHEIGGAGMGEDPKKFVLNRFNQCWDAKNVFVTDGTSFTSGCCQNITLTIMALTVRSCDYIVREYRAGRL